MCSSKRMLLMTEILAVFFLLGSLVSPWYFVSVNRTNTDGAETDVWYLFYWHGYILNQQTSYPASYPVNGTTIDDVYKSVMWGSFNGSHPAILYIASNLLNLAAFLLGSLLMVVSFILNFHHTRKESRVRIQRVFVAGSLICTLMLNALAWGIFFYWPSALTETSFCSQSDTGQVCDDFAGVHKYPGGSTIYGPFLGWAFAVLATPTIATAMVFACVYHRLVEPQWFCWCGRGRPRSDEYNYHSLSIG